MFEVLADRQAPVSTLLCMFFSGSVGKICNNSPSESKAPEAFYLFTTHIYSRSSYLCQIHAWRGLSTVFNRHNCTVVTHMPRFSHPREQELLHFVHTETKAKVELLTAGPPSLAIGIKTTVLGKGQLFKWGPAVVKSSALISMSYSDSEWNLANTN